MDVEDILYNGRREKEERDTIGTYFDMLMCYHASMTSHFHVLSFPYIYC